MNTKTVIMLAIAVFLGIYIYRRYQMKGIAAPDTSFQDYVTSTFGPGIKV